jgi:hypothetical protein
MSGQSKKSLVCWIQTEPLPIFLLYCQPKRRTLALYDNCDQASPPVRLVGSVRKRRGFARVWRISIC